MYSVTSFVLLFRLGYLIGIDVDNHAKKTEGDDWDDHVLPLGFPVQEDCDHENAITEEKGFDQIDEIFGLLCLSIFDFAADVDVCYDEEDEGGG